MISGACDASETPGWQVGVKILNLQPLRVKVADA